MVSLLPLFQLEPGQRARIRQLMGMPDQVHRLEELGLRAGSTVEMVQPGSPCIVRLDGGKLCFRGTEAFSVLVRSCGSASEPGSLVSTAWMKSPCGYWRWDSRRASN
jgi:Fe2+ transport system protein FeoA